MAQRVRVLLTSSGDRGDLKEGEIDADISNLNIGDSLRVSELSEGREFHILNDPELPVVTIAAPVSEEELEAMEAAAGVTGEEPEEAAEGDEGAVEDADGVIAVSESTRADMAAYLGSPLDRIRVIHHGVDPAH